MKKKILILLLATSAVLLAVGNALGIAAEVNPLTAVSEPTIMLAVGSGFVALAKLGRRWISKTL
jgi:hypothetical protein